MPATAAAGKQGTHNEKDAQHVLPSVADVVVFEGEGPYRPRGATQRQGTRRHGRGDGAAVAPAGSRVIYFCAMAPVRAVSTETEAVGTGVFANVTLGCLRLGTAHKPSLNSDDKRVECARMGKLRYGANGKAL